jgi:hypothetical protein
MVHAAVAPGALLQLCCSPVAALLQLCCSSDSGSGSGSRCMHAPGISGPAHFGDVPAHIGYTMCTAGSTRCVLPACLQQSCNKRCVLPACDVCYLLACNRAATSDVCYLLAMCATCLPATELQQAMCAATELQQGMCATCCLNIEGLSPRVPVFRNRAATELQQSCNRAATELQQHLSGIYSICQLYLPAVARP